MHDLAAVNLQDVGLDLDLPKCAVPGEQIRGKHRAVLLRPMLHEGVRDRRIPFLRRVQQGLGLADQFEAVIATQLQKSLIAVQISPVVVSARTTPSVASSNSLR